MRSETVPGSAGPGLARRLEAARARAFVGREPELAAFRAALSGDSPVAVLWVHGPGGIGKSTLTRLWVQEARQAGRSVVEVDGRFVTRDPEQFEQTAAAVLEDGSAVLVVDSFEQCQWLEAGGASVSCRAWPTARSWCSAAAAGPRSSGRWIPAGRSCWPCSSWRR